MSLLMTHRELLIAWTIRTIRARYQQSLLGGLWAIFQPAATVAIFSVIFTVFIPVDTGGIPYIVFSFTAMVPWTLFSSSITDMVDSLVSNINLVSKIYFPREILPISGLLARLLDFFIASIILFLMILIYRLPIFFPGLLVLPLILTIQLSLALGIGFFVSASNVFFRDVRHLVTLGLQLWLYASPVIYPVSAVPPSFRPLYFLNPMAGAIEAYRSILLYQRMPDYYLLFSAGSAFFLLILGYWYFKRVENQFADVI
jgi:lipopolysaccharide transport system permease protein